MKSRAKQRVHETANRADETQVLRLAPSPFGPVPNTRSRGCAGIGRRGSNHFSYVAVLENRPPGLECFPRDDVYHGPRQIVGANHLVGKQPTEHRVDRS
jgi:hypothetical protein